ncbi:MAG: hypothetical protein SXA11_08545 [Cyanobacteriota bacterium]|nr:hypothetical protein [Cyanobacteriota bacterium]
MHAAPERSLQPQPLRLEVKLGVCQMYFRPSNRLFPRKNFSWFVARRPPARVSFLDFLEGGDTAGRGHGDTVTSPRSVWCVSP